MGTVCYETDWAVRAHSAGPSFGADVRGGIVGPSVCIEATELQDRIPNVTVNVTSLRACSVLHLLRER